MVTVYTASLDEKGARIVPATARPDIRGDLTLSGVTSRWIQETYRKLSACSLSGHIETPEVGLSTMMPAAFAVALEAASREDGEKVSEALSTLFGGGPHSQEVPASIVDVPMMVSWGGPSHAPQRRSGRGLGREKQGDTTRIRVVDSRGEGRMSYTWDDLVRLTGAVMSVDRALGKATLITDEGCQHDFIFNPEDPEMLNVLVSSLRDANGTTVISVPADEGREICHVEATCDECFGEGCVDCDLEGRLSAQASSLTGANVVQFPTDRVRNH